MAIDYYKILRVDYDASPAEIERAYIRLSIFYNPDRNPSLDSLKRLIEVMEAYEVLSNYISRAHYDLKMGIMDVEQLDKITWDDSEMVPFNKSMGSKAGIKKNNSLSIEDEIKLALSYLPNIIFILLSALSVIAGFEFLFKSESGWIPIFMILAGLIIGFLLIKRTQTDYLEERKHKLNNLKN